LNPVTAGAVLPSGALLLSVKAISFVRPVLRREPDVSWGA
jgi:hypothetical protein